MKFLFLITGEVKATPSIALASLDEANLLAPPPKCKLSARKRWERSCGSFAFIAQWCFDLRVAVKVISTTWCFSSSLAARDFISTLRC